MYNDVLGSIAELMAISSIALFVPVWCLFQFFICKKQIRPIIRTLLIYTIARNVVAGFMIKISGLIVNSFGLIALFIFFIIVIGIIAGIVYILRYLNKKLDKKCEELGKKLEEIENKESKNNISGGLKKDK